MPMREKQKGKENGIHGSEIGKEGKKFARFLLAPFRNFRVRIAADYQPTIRGK